MFARFVVDTAVRALRMRVRGTHDHAGASSPPPRGTGECLPTHAFTAFTVTLAIQSNSIQFNSIRAGVSRREVIGGIFATETRGGVGGEDPTG